MCKAQAGRAQVEPGLRSFAADGKVIPLKTSPQMDAEEGMSHEP